MASGTPPKIFLTPEGHTKLEAELKYLKTEKRKAIAKKISSAKELGDLSENAEYAEAKDEQAFTEARILELERVLKYAEVVPVSVGGSGVVVLGSTVMLKTVDGTRTYTIVGFSE